MGQDICVEIKPNISSALLRHAEILRRYDMGVRSERYHIRIPGSNSFTVLFATTCCIHVDIVSDENKRAVFNWIAGIVRKEGLTIDEFSMGVR